MPLLRVRNWPPRLVSPLLLIDVIYFYHSDPLQETGHTSCPFFHPVRSCTAAVPASGTNDISCTARSQMASDSIQTLFQQYPCPPLRWTAAVGIHLSSCQSRPFRYSSPLPNGVALINWSKFRAQLSYSMRKVEGGWMLVIGWTEGKAGFQTLDSSAQTWNVPSIAHEWTLALS